MQSGSPLNSTSSKGNVWVFPENVSVSDEVLKIAQDNNVLANLLCVRGYDTEEKAKAFLNLEEYKPTSPMELPDVDTCVRRITEAIHNKEHITVYGDYDVDGITSTSVLLSVLKELGADVDYYIPNRISEGYGLNLKAVSILASKHKTKLIITCDCGVSNFSEINFAKSLGVDTLVLDHHTMPEMLPPAQAIVHPKLLDSEHPLYDLPGVGVAYKVAEALLADNGKAELADDLIDLVTMGMIADLVPLVRENRYIVRLGLTKLLETKRVGLQALLSQVRTQKSTDLVGFGIAPRLNAAGRLSDANKAVELMTTTDEAVASEIAGELEKENKRRQELCETIFQEADYKVQSDKNLANKKCIAIYDQNWHHGVVGIVASRLVEKYHRPVFIGQLISDEGIVKGSARGVSQIDLFEVLKENEHILSKWGGHKMAAGFSVDAEKADKLMSALVTTCNKMLEGKPLTGVVKIDLTVDPSAVDLKLASDLMVLAPFGMGNRKPRLCMESLMCSGVRALGKEKKHSRIMVKQDGSSEEFECVMWNTNGIAPEIGQQIDIAFTPEVNHFNNRDRLQLVLADWRSTSGSQTAAKEATEIESDPLYKESADKAQANESAKSAVASKTDKSAVASEITTLVDNIELPTRSLSTVQKNIWRDLRQHSAPLEVLKRASEKLGDDLVVFAETAQNYPNIKFSNRLELKKANHLIIWQYPSSMKEFERLMDVVQPQNVYLVGRREYDFDNPVQFLKRLYGLVRYAVNKKDGVIEGELMTALMASCKLSCALGLTVLRTANMIDWFAEEGLLNLDILQGSKVKLEECPEYVQLESRLQEVKRFRDWCGDTTPKDIQLAFVKNAVSLAKQETRHDDVASIVNEEEAYDNADGKNRGKGIETSS